jgi:hypothetical protein
MAVGRVRTRAFAGAAAVCLALAAVVGGEVPAVAHSNSCSTGSSSYVVIVFEHANQGGANDDICWKDGYSEDDQFSVNEANVDDIGENANFHDIVSSMSDKNFGSANLCVHYYRDANQGGALQETQWIPASYGDVHYDQAAHNDSYDSLDLSKVSLSTCAAG